MKAYFNTKAFEHHYGEFDVTTDASEAELLVMGAKTVEIEKFKNLKAVYRFGVGTDNVPFDYLKEHDIPVHFPSDEARKVLYESTANFAVYFILQMNFGEYLGDVGEWKKRNRDFLGSKNLLVIGNGNIGSRIAKKAEGFMNVKTFDILTDQMSELKNSIQSADYISLHIPLTDENRNFIDKEKLSWMKDDSVLVNTARGALVNEDALYDRLTTTNIRAAFDVFWVEPYHGKLSKFPKEKFFMTPHTSSQTREFVEVNFSAILDIVNRGTG